MVEVCAVYCYCLLCVYVAYDCVYVCRSDCVGVCGNVCCVAAVVKNSGFLILGVLKYVVCLCREYDGCCVFCLNCEVWSCRCLCIGSVSVSSLQLLMLVEDSRGDHMGEAYSRAGFMTAL